jgi:predicted Zn-dependent peptidase
MNRLALSLTRSLALLTLTTGVTVLPALGCGGAAPATFGPQKVDIPIRDTTKVSKKGAAAHKEGPPAPLASRESPFPAVKRTKLPNGMDIAVARAGSLPVVHVRLVVRVGANYGTPGAGAITASLLKDGGTRTMTSAALLSRLETLGASLGVSTDFDKSTFSLAVVKDKLPDALAVLAEMISAPRFDEGELKKLKARMSDEADEAAKSNGTWMAMRVAFRELYSDKSPYATYELLPTEIAKVDGKAVRDFYKAFYVPKNTELVLAGDVGDAEAEALAKKHFSVFAGGDPPKVEFPTQIPPAKRRVLVVDRPKSVQSDIFVVGLAPERTSPAWADLRVANQILGGGVASRLFMDVREQRSLAYSTRSQIVELARGAQPLVCYAGTQTPKTADAVQGLLDNVGKIAVGPIADAEVLSARRYLSDIFAVRMETVGSIADLIVLADALGLGEGYWDKYREAVRSVDVPRAQAASKVLFSADKVIVVVAGDAGAITKDLGRFGEVVVIDPAKGFQTR